MSDLSLKLPNGNTLQVAEGQTYGDAVRHHWWLRVTSDWVNDSIFRTLQRLELRA